MMPVGLLVCGRNMAAVLTKPTEGFWTDMTVVHGGIGRTNLGEKEIKSKRGMNLEESF